MTMVNAFDDARFAKAVEATGRKKLIIAGASTEVCLALPAIFATGIGYDAHAVITPQQNALNRFRSKGVFPGSRRGFGALMIVHW